MNDRCNLVALDQVANRRLGHLAGAADYADAHFYPPDISLTVGFLALLSVSYKQLCLSVSIGRLPAKRSIGTALTP